MKHITIFLLFISALFLLTSCNTDFEKHKNEYNYQRGLEYLADNDTANAIQYFELSLQNYPDNGYVFQKLASICFNQGQYGDALNYINQSIHYISSKDKKELASSYALRAEIYLTTDDTGKALKDYSKAISKTPDPNSKASFLLSRANIYYLQQDYPNAQKDFKTVLSINQTNQTALSALARTLIDQNRYDEALPFLDKVITLHPDYIPPYKNRILTYIELNDYESATDDFITIFKINPHFALEFLEDTPMSDSTANIFLSSLAEVAKEYPTDALNLFYIGLAHMDNDPITAIKYFHQTLNLDEDLDGAVFEDIATCYSNLGIYNRAVNYYYKAIEKNDEYELNILESLQYDLYDAGRIDEAISVCDKLIKHNPFESEYYTQRALCKSISKTDLPTAIKDYEKALELDSSDVHVLMQLGRLNNQIGKNDVAQTYFLKALQLDSTQNTVSYYLYHYLGDDAKAVETLNSVLEDNETSSNMYDAACLYSIMNKTDLALDYLQKALEKGYVDLFHLIHDSDLDNIRNTERYKQLEHQYSTKIKELELSIDDPFLSRKPSENKVKKTIVEEYIPFTRKGKDRSMEITCTINGAPIKMIFDTGCEDILISQSELDYLLKNEYINEKDLKPGYYYSSLANGERVKEKRVILRNVQFGNMIIHNVTAGITQNHIAEPLFGLGVLSKLESYEIDNTKNTIRIRYQK